MAIIFNPNKYMTMTINPTKIVTTNVPEFSLNNVGLRSIDKLII